MAQWFDKLKQFAKVNGSLKIGDIAKVKLFSDNSGDRSLFHYENHSKTININVAREELTDPRKRRELLDIVRGAALEEKTEPLLEVEASKEVELIEAVEAEDPILTFFRDKLSKDDVQILKSALVIKQQYQSGLSVDRQKHELMQRYGKRAGDIANLCSAGYFETAIKPMYEELSKRPNFTPKMFTGYFDTIVSNRPFVVFINRTQPYDTLRDEIIEKIETNRSYGRKELNIHAIGANNVTTLDRLLVDQSIKSYFSDDPSIIQEGSIKNARIFF